MHKAALNLGGVGPWKRLLQTVDLFNGCIRQNPGGPFVGAFLCHGGYVRKVLLVVFQRNVLLKWFSTIMGQSQPGGHTHGVWSWESSSQDEYLPAVRCRIFMRLKEGLRKTADKEQAVAGVRDDEVREDGMGMAAGTDI